MRYNVPFGNIPVLLNLIEEDKENYFDRNVNSGT